MNNSVSMPVRFLGLFALMASTTVSFADVVVMNTLVGASGSPASYATFGTVSSFNYGYLDETFQTASIYETLTSVTLDLNFASASDTSTVYLYHVGDSSYTTIGTASSTGAGEQLVTINSLSYALNPNQAYAVILGTGAATGVSWYDTSATASGGNSPTLYGIFLVSPGQGSTQSEPGNFRMEIMAAVPEPMNVSLMGLGAVALTSAHGLRRKFA